MVDTFVHDPHADERAAAVRTAMSDIRVLEADMGVSRAGVEAIRDRLVALVSHRHLFSREIFPPPAPGARQRSCLYRIAQGEGDRFALYVNSSDGTSSTPVHDHTTWAVVVGFEGREVNRFFTHGDPHPDGGPGGPVQCGEFTVERGTGVAMLPDDLHSIHLEGAAMNFHLYGLALERLHGRRYWHPGEQAWKVFPAHSDIREARPPGDI